MLVDPKVDLTPNPSFGAAMLTCVPLTFTLDLDPGASDQEVQWGLRAMIQNVSSDGGTRC
jgi:hypothetical protein